MRRRGMGVVGRVRRVRERKSVVVVVVGVTYIRVMSISMYIDRQIDRQIDRRSNTASTQGMCEFGFRLAVFIRPPEFSVFSSYFVFFFLLLLW